MNIPIINTYSFFTFVMTTPSLVLEPCSIVSRLLGASGPGAPQPRVLVLVPVFGGGEKEMITGKLQLIHVRRPLVS